MAKQQLIELVNHLTKSGIEISFTKPKSKLLVLLQQQKALSSTSNT
jgi:hypothetical protein